MMCLCLAALLTLSCIQYGYSHSVSLSFIQNGPVNIINGAFSDVTEERRTKRGVVIGSTVLDGLRATKSILKGSQQIPDHLKMFNDIKEFHKRGGYLKAYEDFHSVHPKNIKEVGPAGSMRTIGKVGDRMLILEQSGMSGSPSLEIVKGFGSFRQNIDLIYYAD